LTERTKDRVCQREGTGGAPRIRPEAVRTDMSGGQNATNGATRHWSNVDGPIITRPKAMPRRRRSCPWIQETRYPRLGISIADHRLGSVTVLAFLFEWILVW
jgi:hypothetical protein